MYVIVAFQEIPPLCLHDINKDTVNYDRIIFQEGENITHTCSIHIL